MRPQEEELEKLNNSSLELAEHCSDSKISVSIQQITSRFQSIQTTCKVSKISFNKIFTFDSVF